MSAPIKSLSVNKVFLVNPTDNKSVTEFGHGNLSAICFLKGTKITLSDRSYKNIEDLTLADDVLTYKINGLDNIRKKEEIIKWEKDKLIGEFSESGIRNIWINPTQTYLTINNKLHVTPGHVMFFRRENKYYFSHAVNLMKQYDISQIPVKENGKFVGSLSDHAMYEKILEDPRDVPKVPAYPDKSFKNNRKE